MAVDAGFRDLGTENDPVDSGFIGCIDQVQYFIVITLIFNKIYLVCIENENGDS